MDWCREEMKDPRKKKLYYYAIMLNWNCGLRFGEMAGLRWTDYDTVDQYLEISGQGIETVELQKDGSFKTIPRHRVEYLKGNEAARKIGLKPRDIQVLEEIRNLHLSETEIFPEGFFRYGTYNGKKKCLPGPWGIVPKDIGHIPCGQRALPKIMMKRTICFMLRKRRSFQRCNDREVYQGNLLNL